MNRIETIGNYVIITENIGDPSEVVKEFAQKSTTYSHNEASDQLEINDRRTQRAFITESSITNGDWKDADDNVLDLAGMLLFLRENTGNFKKDIDVGVISVSGTYVDNSDPANPIVKQYHNHILSEDFDRTGQTTEGLINQQANTFENYLQLEINPLITSKYRFVSNFIYSLNTTNQDFLCQMELENVTDSNTIVFRQSQMELKDSAGSGVVLNILQNGNIVGNQNSATNQRYIGMFRKFQVLEAGKQYFLRLQWSSTQANQEAAIYQGDLSVTQKTIDL